MARPTDYREEFCGRVIEMGRIGKSKAQIAAGLDISRQTLDNWAEAHPEFLDAVKAARDLALAWWEDQGQDGLTAEKFNATAFIFQMKNRFRSDYRDKQDHEHSGPTSRRCGPFRYLDLTMFRAKATAGSGSAKRRWAATVEDRGELPRRDIGPGLYLGVEGSLH